MQLPLTFGKPKTTGSDLFKDMNLKARTKDQIFKTKARTKDSTFKAKVRTKN